MAHEAGHIEDTQFSAYEDLQGFLGELYQQGFAGVAESTIPPGSIIGQGTDRTTKYSIIDDPNTEGDETERVIKALSSFAESKGGIYDVEQGMIVYPDNQMQENEYTSDATLQDFLSDEGSLGYCKGGDGSTKEECTGTWVPYYDEESGINIFENKNEWLAATYPDLPPEQYEAFDTLQFDKQNFEKLLKSIEIQEERQKEFTNRAFDIAQTQRDIEKEAINKQYQSGLISLQETEALNEAVDKAADEAYQRQIGSQSQLEAIQAAVADGVYTEAEAKQLFDLYGNEQGTILRDLQQRFDREKQRFDASEEGVERSTRQRLDKLKLDYDIDSEKEAIQLNQALTNLQIEKEMGSERAKREFTSDFSQARDSLAEANYLLQNMTQGFVGSGMQQERKRDLEKSANERLGRLVTDSYLPQIKNILKTYDIGEDQLKETYGFKASALERTKDLEAGRLTEDKEAALNALETEFGISLEDIGITASDVIDSALREQQAGEFDAIARQNRLREEERNLDNRRQQQIAGLLTEEETAQLRKDEALFAIEQQTEDSLSSATTLLDDYIGSILEQYDALPEPEDDDDDDDDDDTIDPEVPVDVDPELQRGKDYYQRTYGKDPEDMTDAEFIESIQGKFEEDQASDKALKERMIKEKIDEINNNIKTCQEQLNVGAITEGAYQMCKAQNEARIALIEQAQEGGDMSSTQVGLPG